MSHAHKRVSAAKYSLWQALKGGHRGAFSEWKEKGVRATMFLMMEGYSLSLLFCVFARSDGIDAGECANP